MPYDWSSAYNSVHAYDIGNPTSLQLTGIPSAQALGSDTISPTGSSPLTLSGIPSAQAFGVIVVNAPAILSGHGISTSEAFGIMAVNAPVLLGLTGIPGIETFGVITVLRPSVNSQHAARCL